MGLTNFLRICNAKSWQDSPAVALHLSMEAFNKRKDHSLIYSDRRDLGFPSRKFAWTPALAGSARRVDKIKATIKHSCPIPCFDLIFLLIPLQLKFSLYRRNPAQSAAKNW
jgi:hypothetical protein